MKSLPVIPSIKTMGKNTASSVIEVESTAKKISFAPSIPASKGRIPRSIRIYMFSVITMASSTTNPTDSTTANIERTLIEKPAKYIRKNVPINDTGITIQGISGTRKLRRNRKMIITTKIKASYTVFFTSLIEARINFVLSKP